jgi:hypothetical protein
MELLPPACYGSAPAPRRKLPAPDLRPVRSPQKSTCFVFYKFAFACDNFRLLYSNHNGGIVPSAALLSSSSRSLTKVNLQLPFWGDLSFFSRCEAAFLKTQTKPDPSERPPTTENRPKNLSRMLETRSQF